MASVKGASRGLGFACPCQRLQWLYLWILVGCLTPFPADSAGTWWHSLRRGVRGRPSLRATSFTSGQASSSADSPPDGGPDGGHGDLAEVVQRAQASLSALRQQFVNARDWSPQMHPLEVEEHGLSALRICIEEAVSSSGREVTGGAQAPVSPPLLDGIARHGQILKLVSAVTGRVAEYEFRRGGNVWTVKDSSGKVYNPSVWPLDEDAELRRQRAYAVLKWVRVHKDVKGLFGVQSWMDLETRFSVLAPHDVLVGPATNGQIQFASGSVLNSIVLWRSTVATLVDLSRTMGRLTKSLHSSARHAWMARCNLTLQLMRLVGQMAMVGVAPARLDARQFVVNEEGSVFLLPVDDFKRTDNGLAAASTDAAWPDYDSKTLAKDLARILLLVWCPEDAKDVSLDNSAPTPEAVIAVTKSCRGIPSWIENIVRGPFEENIDAGHMLLSSSYHNVYYFLRQRAEVERHGS